MRNTITRTINVTTIKGIKVTVTNGTPTFEPVDPITKYGEFNQAEAEKALRKAYGKHSNVIVSEIVTTEKFFEISIEDFVKHAKEVSKDA